MTSMNVTVLELNIDELWNLQTALIDVIDQMEQGLKKNPNTQDIYGPMIAANNKLLAKVEAAINAMHMESLL